MRYLILVGHATLAQGMQDALEMLLGPRESVIACNMEEGMDPTTYREDFAQAVETVTAEDHVVLLGDIAGGSPLKNAQAVLEEKGLGSHTIVFGGANLPMAISAVMGIEDELDADAIRDAMLAEGAQAVKQL